MLELSNDKYPQVEIKFGGKHSKRGNEIIDVENFIAGKSIRAKGKRLTTYEVDSIRFIEPLQKDFEEPEVINEESSQPDEQQESPTLF
jgi:topoisomerase-4 subunit A